MTLLMLACETLLSRASSSGRIGPNVPRANIVLKPAHVMPCGLCTLTSKSCCMRSAARMMPKHKAMASTSAPGSFWETASLTNWSVAKRVSRSFVCEFGEATRLTLTLGSTCSVCVPRPLAFARAPVYRLR
jgi:hypothetical protein